MKQQICNKQAASQQWAEREKMHCNIQEGRSPAFRSQTRKPQGISSHRSCPDATNSSNVVHCMGVNVDSGIFTFGNLANKVEMFGLCGMDSTTLHKRTCNVKYFLLGSSAPQYVTMPLSVEAELKRYSFRIFFAINRVVTPLSCSFFMYMVKCFLHQLSHPASSSADCCTLSTCATSKLPCGSAIICKCSLHSSKILIR